MGEVYRATDTKLGREVAIKILPSAFANDTERLARFEREAKLLATLNHPHIASVFSLDEHEGTRYLAMELVEGETLEEKLKPGPLPIEDALRLGLQIAQALEAAHDKGVIHRDLKPANIMVNTQGQVKVLDFGLAKAFGNEPAEASPSQSPALSLAMTQQGLILGTAGYMSPEQASGQATDQRADIWAFGVVLYEMLTGLPLFSGESVPHILADVLKTEPNWSRLPKNLHPRIRQTLERCLAKKPRKRYTGIGDARVDIEEVLSDPAGMTPAPVAHTGAAPVSGFRRFGLPAGLMMVAAAIAGLAVWFAMLPKPPEPEPVERFVYDLPDGQASLFPQWHILDISPDGRHFVYNETQGVFVRTLDQIDARLISGIGEDRVELFMSPDGQSVGYATPANPGIAINRIAITGGAPVRLAVIDNRGLLLGASWAADDTIFVGTALGIYRVSAIGGEAELIIPSANGESLSFPRLLPDGDSLLFSVTAGNDWDTGQIVVESLTTGERKVLVNGGNDARYLPTGHLVFAFEGSLLGIAFDAQTLSVSGARVPLVQGVSRSGTRAHAHYGVSENGTLIYLSGTVSAEGTTLVWADRDGKIEPIEMPSRNYQYAALSPDGARIVTDIREQESDTWIWDLERESLQRLTFDPGLNRGAVWSPDGTRVAFSRELDGTEEIYWQSADGSGVAEPLTERSPAGAFPSAFSADGAVLFYIPANPPYDIWAVPVAGPPSEATPLLVGRADERNASLSPDGRWLAYESNESGQVEVYVRPYPAVETGRWQISTGGGTRPQWRGDGRELFYLIEGGPDDTLMAVPIQAEQTFRPGAPQVLFQHDIETLRSGAHVYDVTPDGQRFLLVSNEGASTAEAARFIIVQNWFEELKRLVPTQ